LPTQEEIDAAVKAYEEALGGGASEASEATGTETTGVEATGTETTGTETTEPTETQTAETGSDLPSLLAAASPENGEKLSKQCATCHNFKKGTAHKVGPNLWGVVGGPAAHAADYSYSGAMKDAAAAGWTWTFDTLNAYLENPREAIPGNKMTFAGMSKAEDRADLIAWLRLQSDSPVPLP
jgi:cytochrome c